ncbi:nucleotide-binding oligomerization domain-containing protein 2 [Protopterus annectens]|uniref:nucleotide-binding oligomerization domain-containing protein 2 n=1 Tax=Protopterus annectens TaxID=7888 RepID=UPI001CFB9903|nr:nucleotide-binding oligomerization domain-containing protein 2 [Protopterus annectens]XP_043937925.1 nucleotide-binding oligomerization domain-containing protein 2 [Protopterus annectens]XP_043937926.1 nucleotide-binding oligomerization domain-containing protein 2 [Protopterus annectens]
MSAQQDLRDQRDQLVTNLGRGAAENFQSILDLLLSWEVLTWEDYESINIPVYSQSNSVRTLLDIVSSKGEQACELFVSAFKTVHRGTHETESALPTALSAVQRKESCSAVLTLQKLRPVLVKKIHSYVGNILKELLAKGLFTTFECDEIQLPINTPSQQARHLLNLSRTKDEAVARYLLNYIQHLEENSQQPVRDFIWQSYKNRLRSIISAQSQYLNTYDRTENVSLEDIYIDGVLEVQNAGSDNTQKHSSCILGLTDIFSDYGTSNEEADTVVILGEAGSGKSTLLQQLHRLWATDRAFQNFWLIFPFSCRSLNSIEGPLSLKSLLFEKCCWSGDDQDKIFQWILNNPEKILFTFDGFDEFKFKFTDVEKHCSPTNTTTIQNILFNLIQGNLMKNAKKLVTSRPGAVSPVMKKYIQKEVNLKGFSQEGIELFIRKHYSDVSTADQLINLVKTNSALHALCHVPVFCWIVSKCHKELMPNRTSSLQTMTDVYFLILQHLLLHTVGHCELAGLQSKANTVRHLSKLAFNGLCACCYMFSRRELQEAEVGQEDISAGFLVHSRSFSCKEGTSDQHFEFLHITIQCFFAALHIALNNGFSHSAICVLFKCSSKRTLTGCTSMHRYCFYPSHEQDEENRTLLLDAERPNLELTATFLAGLLSSRHVGSLSEFYERENILRKHELVKKYLIKGMQKHFRSIPAPLPGEKKSMHAMPEFIWLIKCIYEIQDCSFAKHAVAKLDVEHLKLTYCGIGPAECTALAYVLKHLKIPIGLQLDHNLIGDVGTGQLLPCLGTCHSLYLRNNNISDDGIAKLLERVLQCPDFNKIALFNNNLTDDCMHWFAKLLKQNQHFLALRLGNNHIKERGAEDLAKGLKANNSIQWLGLWGNKIGDRGACAIAEALHNNTSLIWLSLVDNNIGNIGIQGLAMLIEKNTVLEELCLDDNKLEDEDVYCLADAILKNSALKILKLTNNRITTRGIMYLLEKLESNTTIKSVWLRGNQLTDEEQQNFEKTDERLTF